MYYTIISHDKIKVKNYFVILIEDTNLSVNIIITTMYNHIDEYFAAVSLITHKSNAANMIKL